MIAGVMNMTREQADTTIATWTLPDAIIGTSPSRSALWCDGGDRDLRHDHWLIRTGRRIRDRTEVHFNVVVEVGGVRLAPADALTKKVLTLCWLAGITRRGKLQTREVGRLAARLDWFFRYRLSLGIRRNVDLHPEHLSDFRDRARSGPLVELVPVLKRISAFSARRTIACDSSPRPDAGAAVPSNGIDALAAELGVTARSIPRSSAAVAELRVAVGWDGGRSASARKRDLHPNPKTVRRHVRGLQSLLQVWDDLHDLGRRGIVHDPLPFEPFPGRSARAVALVDGTRGDSQEAVAPAALFAWLLAACVVVTVWGEAIRDAVELYHRGEAGKALRRRSLDLDSQLPVGMPKVWLSWKWYGHEGHDVREGRLNLTELVETFLTAVLVIVTTFSACGVEDALELPDDAVTEPRPGYFELVVRSDPFLGALRAVPIPPIVVTALAHLRTLTASTRAWTGDTQLFRVAWTLRPDPTNASLRMRHCSIPANGYLGRFATLHGLPPLAPGTDQTTGNQFRSGFATALLCAVPGGSWEALRAFLGVRFLHHLRAYVQGSLPGRIAALREKIESLKLQADTVSRRERLSEAWALLSELKQRRDAVDDAHLREFVGLALAIAIGDDRTGGRAGDRLEQDVAGQVARVQADFESGFRNFFDPAEPISYRAMRELYGNYGFGSLPEGHVWCACRRGHPADLAAAVCLRRKAAARQPWMDPAADQAPDPAYAGIATCLGTTPQSDAPVDGRGGCAHAVATAANRAVIDRACQDGIRSVAQAPNPASRERAKAVVAAVIEAALNARPKGT